MCKLDTTSFLGPRLIWLHELALVEWPKNLSVLTCLQVTCIPPWIPWRRLPGSWGPACSRRVSVEAAAWGPRTG